MNAESWTYSPSTTLRQSGRAFLRHARNEYRIASQLDASVVVKPLSLERKDGVDTLVLEDFGGEPLERLLTSPMAPGRFLELAVRTAAALAEIHRRGVIHKDIKPENIIVNEATGEVKVTDFGIATLLPRERPLSPRPLLVEGTLAYISPEQTGRMNRAVDRRADLYSLGVVFYRMLAGRTPFEASDALEWIHYHIARRPTPISDVVPGLPSILSDIVLKLLAKDPEQRYQTADGLKHDLERCLASWLSDQKIDSFPLGDEFLAVASHELNTPMTALVLTLQTLLEPGHELPPDRQLDIARMAERAAGRMSRLIGELLDVTRIERGTLTISREKIDLEELVRGAIVRFTPELTRAQSTVAVRGSGPIIGWWDRSRIEQIFVNLLSNAIKFGSGKPIEVALGQRDGVASFAVTDHGIGIEPASQARIFERFERAVSVRHYGGLGLGLYICRRIIDAHGSSIRVESHPGAGATFTVELPCSPASELLATRDRT